ncbi:MAG TPA: hypothetical protein PK163_07180 [Steroidobacteraceae bacterium]|nr:hypothetical protein [Steroidobacteraceae bacterium]
MKPSFWFAAVVLAAGSTWTAGARADSADARCEVRRNGETKAGASGPCTFSQRQGHIDIDLKNGDTVSLSPGNKANVYRDGKGDKVERSRGSGNSDVFKWENGRKLIVTFLPAAASHAAPAYSAGAPAPDLQDLVGAKGGQAEGQLENRGYKYQSGSTSGNSKYSNWYNKNTGRCVTIRTEDGRYQSIVQAPPVDCGH